MSFMVSEEVTVKEGGPRMIVTGYSSGMVECRWYDGYGVKREAFHETELVPGEGSRPAEEVGKGFINPRPDVALTSHPVGCASVCTELPDATLSRLIMPTL